MELNLELTPRSKILLGILAGVLLIVVLLQGAPVFYRLFANQDAKAKQEQLQKTENLILAAEVLSPIEFELYKATGLALAADPQINTRTQGAATLFDTESPETVIRTRIDSLVRRAGIQQNYQLLTQPGTTKQTQKLTLQTRQNLVRYLYLKHIEAEEKELTAIVEQQTEADAFSRLMDAWLSETETDEKDEKEDGSFAKAEPSTKNPDDADKARPTHSMNTAAQWTFVPLPEGIPVSLRIELAAFIKTMTLQQLRGATDFRHGFFEAQIHKATTPATPGIFGIGAKPATTEIQLRRKRALFNFLTHALDTMDTDAALNSGEIQAALVSYIERIQEQQATLLDRLALAPATYPMELYTVEMKFKTNLEKLVRLNYFIETGAKWLTVRDLRISADKQATSRPEASRGRNSADANANLNVDIFLIARIF